MQQPTNCSGFAAHFHFAPFPRRMESQGASLTRLQLNTLLKSYCTLQDLELKDQTNKETASELFFSGQHMYKNWDYRCLVPYSHKDPTKWRTYEMHDYRRAFNKETLKSVDQYKYDNNFFNWVDPKVLKYFTASKRSMKRAWKETYGIPYTTALSWDGHIGGISPEKATKCFMKCAHYVSNPSHRTNNIFQGQKSGGSRFTCFTWFTTFTWFTRFTRLSTFATFTCWSIPCPKTTRRPCSWMDVAPWYYKRDWRGLGWNSGWGEV